MTAISSAISQILPESPFLFGPLADACRNTRPARIRVEMSPVDVYDGGATPSKTTQIKSVNCRWHLATDRGLESGSLSIMSFIAIWNEKVEHIDGVPLDSILHDEKIFAKSPFLRPHPCGFLQAITYDLETDLFCRAILYPIG